VSRGILGRADDPNVARQHPLDWSEAMEAAVRDAIASARGQDAHFEPTNVIGIGIDATASTPLPVDARLRPLVLEDRFADDLDAHAWLWKDHTAHAEAQEITEVARRLRPQYLAKCGGAYSSEWFFSKLLHGLRVAPAVLAAADGWVEEGDYIAGILTGPPRRRSSRATDALRATKRSTATHGAASRTRSSSPRWIPRLERWCRGRLPRTTLSSAQAAGGLRREWAERWGLPAGVPVAAAAIDAHLGAVGAGVRPGRLVKVLGTSGCDMLVHPASSPLPAEIPGICGVAADSILPGYLGLEAGQSALGDLFGWFVRFFPRGSGISHDSLSDEAAKLRPGESGLVALDWNNGNRSVLADPLLTGLLVGQTLQTRPAEVYRALLEAAAFGARVILERFRGARRARAGHRGVRRRRGAEPAPSPDPGGRHRPADKAVTLAGDLRARSGRLRRRRQRAWSSVEEAQAAMTGLQPTVHEPDPTARGVYDELFALYRSLHDAFGVAGARTGMDTVMKRLIEIRRARTIHALIRRAPCTLQQNHCGKLRGGRRLQVEMPW
jgi:L-ribulokinase